MGGRLVHTPPPLYQSSASWAVRSSSSSSPVSGWVHSPPCGPPCPLAAAALSSSGAPGTTQFQPLVGTWLIRFPYAAPAGSCKHSGPGARSGLARPAPVCFHGPAYVPVRSAASTRVPARFPLPPSPSDPPGPPCLRRGHRRARPVAPVRSGGGAHRSPAGPIHHATTSWDTERTRHPRPGTTLITRLGPHAFPRWCIHPWRRAITS